MAMSTSLYECSVMHHRTIPIRHRFVYRLFMFCLDLDEINTVAHRLRLVSRNRWNIFSFRDSDHLQRGYSSVRENIIDFVHSKGVTNEVGKIFLMTHLRTLGYVFNPVSFYFCFDNTGHPLCAVAEVSNTFGEMKPFLFRMDDFAKNTFTKIEQKYFYVSPFIPADALMEFHLKIPDDTLDIRINDFEKEKKFLITTLTGKRRSLTDARLALYVLKFPVITIQVIVKIHWQALLLYLKRLPFYPKQSHLDLQKEVYHANH